MNDFTTPLKILNHLNAIADGRLVCCEINPTNLCTRECDYCFFKEYRKKKPVSIPRETLFSLLADLKQMNCKSVIFSGGGEPLCHPNIEEALWYAKGLGLEIGLITNGDLLSKEINDTVLYTCDWVKVSVKLPLSGYYSKYLKDLISKRKHTVVSLSTIGDFSSTEVTILKQAGFKPDFFTAGKIKQNKPESRNYDKCLVTQSYTAIGPDCEAYACCSFMGNKKMSYGNIKDTPLSELWKGKKRQKVLGKIAYCPPCRFDKQNEIFDYLKGEKLHRNFI